MKTATPALIVTVSLFLALGSGCGGPTPSDGTVSTFYGDGSAGAKTVAANEDLADTNCDYTNFTVNAGVTLNVPSGTIIRCTGTFRNEGTIRVIDGAPTAIRTGTLAIAPDDDTTFIELGYNPPHPGVARLAAGSGEVGPIGASRGGGFGGQSFLTAAEAGLILHPGIFGGGGGGAGLFFGGEGGGAVTILAHGEAINIGTINANAVDAPTGGGGGGGGVVLIGSATGITNAGTITANGGRGGESDFRQAPGAGGGGGIIHLVSGTITNTGTRTVTRGAAGTAGAAGSVTSMIRSGGGGGGACGSAGGIGGSVSGNTPNAGTDGADGFIIQTNRDPELVF